MRVLTAVMAVAAGVAWADEGAGACVDSSSDCHSWAVDGLCESQDVDLAKETREQCPWSCGICTVDVKKPAPPLPDPNERSTWSMATAGLDRIEGFEAEGAVLTAEVCKKLIEAGEKTGFKMAIDSIDSNPAMDISVYNHNRVKAPLVWDILEPFVPIFKAELDKRYPGSANELDWVFFRKYKAGTVRSALLGHKDSNEHSISLSLNVDFEGGGLYFVPPESEMGRIANAAAATAGESDKLNAALQPEHIPGPEHGNQSNYFFPYVAPGSAMVYDKTVWHGVTPVTKGIRYALSFFYDEPLEIKYQDDPELLEKALEEEAAKEAIEGSDDDEEVEEVEESETKKPEVTQPDTDEVEMTVILENKQTHPNMVKLYWIANPDILYTSGRGNITIHNPDDVVYVGDGTEDEPEWNGPIALSTYSSHYFAAIDGHNVIVHAWLMTQSQTTYTLTDEHTTFRMSVPAEEGYDINSFNDNVFNTDGFFESKRPMMHEEF